MKQIREKIKKIGSRSLSEERKTILQAAFLCVIFVSVGILCLGEKMKAAGEDMLMTAAAFTLPEGAVCAFWEKEETSSESENSQFSEELFAQGESESVPPPEGSLPEESPPSEEQSDPRESLLPDGAVEAVIIGDMKEMTIQESGTNLEDIWVLDKNENYDVDIAAVLEELPDVVPLRDGTPEILIYHTHATEAYQNVSRTLDETQNVIAVGSVITAILEEAGYGVIHDKTLHDHPSYNGSYDRSCETIAKCLQENPTIQVTLDIHRDSLGSDPKLKPTAIVQGKKAAQLMIISGCDDDGSLGHPDWEYNLRFAMRLQEKLTDRYPALARPLYFCPRKYNQHMTHGSLLVEVGTDMNTLEEAEYTGELFGKTLIEVLDGLIQERSMKDMPAD